MGWVKGRAYGITLVTAANVLWSTAGLFVRAIDLDVWTMVAWRALFATLALLPLIALQAGRRSPRAFLAIGWPSLVHLGTIRIRMKAKVPAR